MKSVFPLLLGLTLTFAFNVVVPNASYGQNRQGSGAVQTSTEFDIGWISDQRVTGVKKEAAHATYVPYSSRETLSSDECYDAPWLDSQSELIMNLNGTWKFRWVKGTKEGPGPSEFQAADLDDSEWDDIRVPMNWEMTGKYNLPTYNNTGYPFHNRPPYATEGFEDHGIVDHNATGFYRRTFDLPKDWSNKEVFVHFDGVYSCCVVWVNGKFCGYSQGSNTDAEFDITSAVQPGKNQLSVRVYRWCDGSYLEGQDMWRLSGIHRDVYLVAKPKTFIRDHYLTVAEQSADATSGRLQALVSLDNRSGADSVKKLRMELLDAEGVVVAKDEKLVSVTSNGGAIVTLETLKLSNLSAWSADRPYLYTVIMTQCDQSGEEECVFATKYGFRNVG
ncbi:MAG: beta galactosidase jelly roll domain-containing protein, partial [Thermoguttaceae bacterium]|nr:beta galactosidase jelly roll domain-containing protein [Thermoguttaceae bacterium]